MLSKRVRFVVRVKFVLRVKFVVRVTLTVRVKFMARAGVDELGRRSVEESEARAWSAGRQVNG